MSADVLRETARLMRNRAQAASGGRWKWAEQTDAEWVGIHDEFSALGLMHNCDDAFYVASMHPAVALAVADWLDNQANLDEEARAVGGRGLTDIADSVIVARAYLGTDA